MLDMPPTNPAIYQFMEAASPYVVLWSAVFSAITALRFIGRVRLGGAPLPDNAAYTELAGLPLTALPSVAFVWALATQDWLSAFLFLWWGPGFVLTAAVYMRARLRGAPIDWHPVRHVIGYLCKLSYLAYMAVFFSRGMTGMMFAFSVWIINDQFEKATLCFDADRLRRTLDDHWLFRIAYPAGLLTPWFAPAMPLRAFGMAYGALLLGLWGAGVLYVARTGRLRIRPTDMSLLRNMAYFPRRHR